MPMIDRFSIHSTTGRLRPTCALRAVLTGATLCWRGTRCVHVPVFVYRVGQKVGQLTHDHNSVKSEPILKIVQ